MLPGQCWTLEDTHHTYALSGPFEPQGGNANIPTDPKRWKTKALMRLSQGHSPGKGIARMPPEASTLLMSSFWKLGSLRQSRDRGILRSHISLSPHCQEDKNRAKASLDPKDHRNEWPQPAFTGHSLHALHCLSHSASHICHQDPRGKNCNWHIHRQGSKLSHGGAVAEHGAEPRLLAL